MPLLYRLQHAQQRAGPATVASDFLIDENALLGCECAWGGECPRELLVAERTTPATKVDERG